MKLVPDVFKSDTGRLEEIYCYIDASFSVHIDGKGHTGLTLTLGSGSILSMSKKQRLVSQGHLFNKLRRQLLNCDDNAAQSVLRIVLNA